MAEQDAVFASAYHSDMLAHGYEMSGSYKLLFGFDYEDWSSTNGSFIKRYMDMWSSHIWHKVDKVNMLKDGEELWVPMQNAFKTGFMPDKVFLFKQSCLIPLSESTHAHLENMVL